MQDQSTRQTANSRRGAANRQNQVQPQSQPQRNYASENEAATRKTPSHELPRMPRTPQKSASSSPAPVNGQAQSNSKTKHRNRGRPDSISLSPDTSRAERGTPTYSSGPKSSTAAAFAGATFHASPAPSALPLPKFYNKANEASVDTDKAGTSPSNEESSPATDTQVPTPQVGSSGDAVRESPLEFMFRADREEKERARQTLAGSPHNTGGPGRPSPFASRHSPDAQSVPGSVPTHSFGKSQDQHGNELSHGSTSDSKLHGYMSHAGQPIGPAFSTPYQERIRAAREERTSSRPNYGRRMSSDQASPAPIAPAAPTSDELKRLLFAPPVASRQPFRTPAMGPSASVQPRPPNEASPLASGGPERDDARIRAMEEDLRKVLKIDK